MNKDKIQIIKGQYCLRHNIKEQMIKAGKNPIEIIKKQLIHDLAEYMVNNLDKLPMKLKELNAGGCPFTDYEIEGIIIDKEELKRLLDIERGEFSEIPCISEDPEELHYPENLYVED